jgi:oligopeptide transport system permease protein
VALVLIAIFAFFGELISPHDRQTVDFTLIGINATKGVPSLATGHYFGTDMDGRDLYARTVQGTRLSLLIGIVGSLVAVVVGTLYGAIAGYVGGRVDSVMMRIVDILMSIPSCSC